MSYRISARRSFLASAAVVTVAVLAGCGGGPGPGQAAPAGEGPAWCGTEPIVFGMADGGGLNAWSEASAEAVRSVADLCPNVTQVLTSDAGFDLQKAITGLQRMVTQGANAIVIIPDAGGPGTELAGIRSAYQAGVAIVPWGADPGGEPGTDYVAYVDADHRGAGVAQAEWVAQQLPDGGQVAFFSGPAGNGPGIQRLDGIVSVFADRPDIELVTGESDWAIGNWDAAEGQRATAALLSQYPDLDAVITDEGLMTTGIQRAFEAAGRELPLVSSLEANALACEFTGLQKSSPDYQLSTVGAMNFAGRVAAQLAIATAAGVEISEEDALHPGVVAPEGVILLPDPILEDSANGPQPLCDPDEAESALLSNRLTNEQLQVLTQTGEYPEGVIP